MKLHIPQMSIKTGIGTIGIVITIAIIVSFFTKNNYAMQHWKGKYTEIKAMAIRDTVKNSKIIKNLCFKLRIDPSKERVDSIYFHNSDILFGFGKTRDEIATQINEFNFRLYDKIWLDINNKRIIPTLCHFERNYGMDNGRDIWVSFKLDEMQRQQFLKKKKIQLIVTGIFQKEKVAVFNWPLKFFL